MVKEELISFETEIGEIFNAGGIKAPVHLYSGNEDLVIELFKDIDIENDWVCCTWRGRDRRCNSVSRGTRSSA